MSFGDEVTSDEVENDVYDALGVPTVVNAAGTKTRIGGTLIRPEALEAMREAATSFVHLSELHERAGELVADITGSESALVTNGAAGAMVLAAAACIARDDYGVMDRLPNTEGVPDEIVMPRTHRTGYDRSFRTAGATIVDVGTNDRHLGTGSKDLKRWELADSIGDDTAAVGYVQKPFSQPPLDTVVDVAHDAGVPVIVDAAAEIPPTENLSRFFAVGADLVVFSGGKAIRGPQTTGILAGHDELIESAALQHLDMHAAPAPASSPVDTYIESAGGDIPRQGIGRALKVGKEEIVGLVRALECFVDEDQSAKRTTWAKRARRIAGQLAPIEGIETHVTEPGVSVAPEVIVSVGTEATLSAVDLVSELRSEEPRIVVGSDSLDDGEFAINPMCLSREEGDYVAQRIQAHLS